MLYLPIRHAIVFLYLQYFLPKSFCHDFKSLFELPPLSPTCDSISPFVAFPSQELLSRFQVIVSTSLPPKPHMQWHLSIYNPPYPRVIVTIPSHCLNFPPLSPTCGRISPFVAFPSQEFSCHDSKSLFQLPSPKPHMQ